MSLITLRKSAAVLALGTALVVPAVLAAPAQAQGGSPVVKASGSCTGGGVWTLKAKHDNTKISVEFGVDTNKVGQVWNVAITDNAVSVFSGKQTTIAPSGSFTKKLLTTDRAGTDTITARATLGTKVCVGSVKV